MTGPHKHPCYPGTDRPILIGQVAHDGRDQRGGVVGSVSSFGHVVLDDAPRRWVVPVKWLCIGHVSIAEPTLLAIRPTWAELRSLVLMVDSYRDPSLAPPLAASVVNALPADIAARLRAENRAEIEAGL